jgi:hypothetical protein
LALLRFLSRLIGFFLLSAAFVALVIDGTRSIAAGEFMATPLGATAFWLFPTKFPILQPAVERHLHPWLWDPLLVNLLLAPGWAILGALGFLLFAAGLRRAPREGAAASHP